MTTTSMTPQSTQLYQGGNLDQTYSSDAYSQVQASLKQYGGLRDQYVQMINTALQSQDPQTRTAMMPQITAANQQLVALVNQIQQVYNQGQSVLSAQPTDDLQVALDRYKEQLEELRTDEDELVRLNRFYDDMTSTSVIPQATYYGWIIVVLVLLFVVFALFVASAFRSPLQSMLPAMPEFPAMPSLGLGEATGAPTMASSLPSLPTLQ